MPRCIDRLMDRLGAWLFGVLPAATCGTGAPPLPDRAAWLLLEHENAVLGRALAQAQQRTGACVRQLHAQLRGQQVCQMRLQAALVIKQTELMWLRADVEALLGPSGAAADRVICQTGCTGHGHPWREEDGHCRRKGTACTLMDLPVALDPPARGAVLQAMEPVRDKVEG